MNNITDQQRLEKYQKIFNIVKYLPHIVTMCIVYICLPWYIALLFLGAYVFFEKQAGPFADIGGLIVGCLSDNGMPSVLYYVWIAAFSAYIIMEYLVKDLQKSLADSQDKDN